MRPGFLTSRGLADHSLLDKLCVRYASVILAETQSPVPQNCCAQTDRATGGGSVRKVHLGRSTCHAISGRGGVVDYLDASDVVRAVEGNQPLCNVEVAAERPPPIADDPFIPDSTHD